MNKFQKILGHTWASPVTSVGLLYAGTFCAMKWYDYIGAMQDGIIFRVSSNAPKWLTSLWAPWDGHAIGSVVVMNCDPLKKKKQLDHEMVHVRQCMRLGIFQPILYGLCWLAIRFGCESSHPYWSNPFEIDARRQVGQTVDVEGALKRLALFHKE